MFSRKVMGLGALVGLTLSFSSHGMTSRYLVQFKSSAAYVSAVQGFQTENQSSDQGQMFSNSDIKVTRTLNNIEMLVIESGSPAAIALLRARPDIAAIEEEVFHPAPRPIAMHARPTSVSTTRRKKAIPMPWGIKAVKADQAWATTRGAGATVTVLDTGVDLQHPALMAQIDGVMNFTGGDQADVTDVIGHGSHVSGTILADGKNEGLVGVAPEARLSMGKVCTELGCPSTAIASGIDWAVGNKSDVINMSLGGMFITNLEKVALQNAEAAGTVVVAASGNDSSPRVSFPAAFPTSFAVGAVDISLKKADFSNWGPELDIVGPGVDVISSVPRGSGRQGSVQMEIADKGMNEVKSLPMVGTALVDELTNTLVDCGLGRPGDYPADVAGKYALVFRGEITFRAKVDAAIQAGAAGVLIYNNAPGLLQGTVSDDGTEVAIPVAMIEQSQGEAAKAALAGGSAVTSIIDVSTSDYASFQGTSMATPHVAGVVALIRSANQALTPEEVRTLLKGTAVPLSPNDQNQFGSGMVDANAAVQQATTSVLLQIAR